MPIQKCFAMYTTTLFHFPSVNCLCLCDELQVSRRPYSKKKNVSLAYAPTTLFIGPFINYKTNKANPIAEIAMHRYHKIIEGTNKK